MRQETQQARFDNLYRVAKEGINYRRFNMDHFCRQDECGTTLCLAGFAGLDPYFRKRGLVTHLETERFTVNGTFIAEYDLDSFFGIDPVFRDQLFYSSNPTSHPKRTMLNRIRSVMVELGLKAPKKVR